MGTLRYASAIVLIVGRFVSEIIAESWFGSILLATIGAIMAWLSDFPPLAVIIVGLGLFVIGLVLFRELLPSLRAQSSALSVSSDIEIPTAMGLAWAERFHQEQMRIAHEEEHRRRRRRLMVAIYKALFIGGIASGIVIVLIHTEPAQRWMNRALQETGLPFYIGASTTVTPHDGQDFHYGPNTVVIELSTMSDVVREAVFEIRWHNGLIVGKPWYNRPNSPGRLIDLDEEHIQKSMGRILMDSQKSDESYHYTIWAREPAYSPTRSLYFIVEYHGDNLKASLSSMAIETRISTNK